MASFKYRVRDRAGKLVVGTIDAATLQVAGERLHGLGYYPISIEEEKPSGSTDLSDILGRFRKVTPRDLIFFSQQLSTLFKAGVPLLTGLRSILEQTGNSKLRSVLELIGRRVEEGSTLFQALSGFPDHFPSLYISMVQAGETSGKLGESLDRFVALSEQTLKIRQKVKEATRYPKIVIAVVMTAFAFLIIFVIPRIVQAFAQFKMDLPLPTRMMIGVNYAFQNFWYLILPVVVGVPILIRQYIQTEEGRYFWDRIKIRFPVFGPLSLKTAISRFAYSFAMLNRSGIPILQTLDIAATTTGNVRLSKVIEEVKRKVKEGKSLSDSMKESGAFPPLVTQMFSVGESSGTLDQMLMRISEYYEALVDDAVKKLSAYIEPFLVLFLGGVVLILALAVFLPLWNMTSLAR